MKSWTFFIILILLMITTPGCINKTYTNVNEVLLDKNTGGDFIGIVEVMSCLEADEEGQWCKVIDSITDDPEEIWVFNSKNQTLRFGNVVEIRGKIDEATYKKRHKILEDVLFIEVEKVTYLDYE